MITIIYNNITNDRDFITNDKNITTKDTSTKQFREMTKEFALNYIYMNYINLEFMIKKIDIATQFHTHFHNLLRSQVVIGGNI